MPDENPYAKYGGVPIMQSAPAQTSAATTGADNPYAKYGGVPIAPQRVKPNTPATQPGAYQQAPGGPIRNANAEAKAPFSDSTTSVLGNVLGTKPTGALMKRPEESDSQFLARVKAAAKTVKPEDIEAEQRANNARTLPTAAAALAAGPATLGAEAGAARLVARPALQMVEHELVDSAGNPITQTVERNAVGYAKDAVKVVADWAKTNPKTAAVASLAAAQLGVHAGRLIHTLLKLGLLAGE